MTLITKTVTTLTELHSVSGQGVKAVVVYDTSSGEPYGLDVEVLINLKDGVTGASAYQSYLNTTTDIPPLSEEEWATPAQGDAGKSAYQSYLDTTTDYPILTEEQWSNQMGNAESALNTILLILNSL